MDNNNDTRRRVATSVLLILTLLALSLIQSCGVWGLDMPVQACKRFLTFA